MRRGADIDTSPAPARWMKDTLDRDAFTRSIEVHAAKIPAEKTGALLRALHANKGVLRIPRVHSAVRDPTGDRLVLLNCLAHDTLPEEISTCLQAEGATVVKHTLALDYSFYTADDIIHAVLPEELCDGAPTGFSMTGHVAHMNLNDEYLPWKHIIGQIVLDKNPSARTVVNKLDSIDHKFRFFKMELLAGEPDYIVEHHEANCRFTFDFSCVYWNSRLHTEHERLVQLFNQEDVVADVFAGVGPFACPAAKRGCAVLANDLNPNSAKYLQKNADDNQVSSFVRVFCEDGRDFIRAAPRRLLHEPFPPFSGPPSTKRQQEKQRKKAQQLPSDAAVPLEPEDPPRRRIDHFVMNLPDSAITFLDAFRGLLGPEKPNVEVGQEPTSPVDPQTVYGEDRLPMIHCHCFTKEMDPAKAEIDIRQRVEERLGGLLTDEVSLHLVRAVAPNKDMYCISFRLPSAVAFGPN